MVAFTSFIVLLLALSGVHIGGLEQVDHRWLITLFVLSLIEVVLNETRAVVKK